MLSLWKEKDASGTVPRYSSLDWFSSVCHSWCQFGFPGATSPFQPWISAWTRPHASCACKDCRENTTIISQHFTLGLPCSTCIIPFFFLFFFFFLSPALPITWQGYREVPVWADSPSFHWISPSRKTNKTNTATKSKINKTSHPKHFGFSSPSTQLIPVNLILATSHTWSHQSQKCQAGIEGWVSHLADIWWQPLKPCFNIPHPPFKYQTLNLQLHCPAFSTSVP